MRYIVGGSLVALVASTIALNARHIDINKQVEAKAARIAGALGGGNEASFVRRLDSFGSEIFVVRYGKELSIEFDRQARLVGIQVYGTDRQMLTRLNSPQTWRIRSREPLVNTARAILRRLELPDDLNVRHVRLPDSSEELTEASVVFSMWQEAYPLRTNSHVITITMTPDGYLYRLDASYDAVLERSMPRINAEQAIALARRAWESHRLPKTSFGKPFLGYAPSFGFPEMNVKPHVPYRVRLVWVVPLDGKMEAWVDAETGSVIGGLDLPSHQWRR